MVIVNLSYPLHQGMFKYPSDPEIEIDITKAKTEIDRIRYQVLEEDVYKEIILPDDKYKSGFALLRLRNHHETHIDAPAHKFPDGKTIDQYEDSKFVNSSALIDLTSSGLLARKQRRIELSDLQTFDFNQFPFVSGLVIYTGFCDEMRKLEGRLSENKKQAFEKTFPYLSNEAAEYLSGYRLNVVGIDSFSIDPQGSNSESHRLLLRKDILILETLVNLEELKRTFGEKQFCLTSIPYKITEGDAGGTVALATEIKNG